MLELKYANNSKNLFDVNVKRPVTLIQALIPHKFILSQYPKINGCHGNIYFQQILGLITESCVVMDDEWLNCVRELVVNN